MPGNCWSLRIPFFAGSLFEAFRSQEVKKTMQKARQQVEYYFSEGVASGWHHGVGSK